MPDGLARSRPPQVCTAACRRSLTRWISRSGRCVVEPTGQRKRAALLRRCPCVARRPPASFWLDALKGQGGRVGGASLSRASGRRGLGCIGFVVSPRVCAWGWGARGSVLPPSRRPVPIVTGVLCSCPAPHTTTTTTTNDMRFPVLPRPGQPLSLKHA